MSATELFRPFMRDHVAPRLRALGFLGSGQNYRLPNPVGHFALLNFQRSTWNEAQECSFTVNVTFVRREDWPDGTWMGAAPTGGADYPVPGWFERLGFLTGAETDLWWTLRTPEDLPVVATAVVDLIEQHALPALRERIDA